MPLSIIPLHSLGGPFVGPECYLAVCVGLVSIVLFDRTIQDQNTVVVFVPREIFLSSYCLTAAPVIMMTNDGK
jgi:hypothetical protein